MSDRESTSLATVKNIHSQYRGATFVRAGPRKTVERFQPRAMETVSVRDASVPVPIVACDFLIFNYRYKA